MEKARSVNVLNRSQITRSPDDPITRFLLDPTLRKNREGWGTRPSVVLSAFGVHGFDSGDVGYPPNSKKQGEQW